MNLSLDNDFERSFIKKGDAIFKEGELSDKMFLLLSGKVVCFQLNTEQVIPVYSVEGKGIFGEDCVISEKESFSYFAVALEDSTIIKIPKNDITSYLKEGSEWIQNILSDISDKIYHTMGLIVEHKISDDKLVGSCYLSEEDKMMLKKATISKV